MSSPGRVEQPIDFESYFETQNHPLPKMYSSPVPQHLYSRLDAPDTPVVIADPNSAPIWNTDLDYPINLNDDTPSVANGPAYVLNDPYSSRQITPTQSPLKSSAPPSKRHRTLSGLGTPSGVHRSAKKIRQATYDANSIPQSPTPGRRASSLMTSQPLTRNLSNTSSLLSAPPFMSHDRMVSTGSVMSIMSGDGSGYESWAPSPVPQLFSVPEHGYAHPQPIPELSHQPSPNLSNPVASPLGTPSQSAHIFTTSPEADQSDFNFNMGMAYPAGVASGSMASVASFPASGVYRQNTLSTVIETPDLGQSSMVVMPPAPMPSHGQFERVHYPAVPGMSMMQHVAADLNSQSGDVAHWLETTANPSSYGSFVPWNQASYNQAIPRHVSGPTMQMMQPPAFSRSISGPVHGQRMHGLHQLPPHLQAGGFFPLPPPPPPQAAAPPPSSSEFGGEAVPAQNWNYSEPAEASTSAQNGVLQSPDTPRRQRHPRMATYMKPGPKPKSKTPRKGPRRSQSSPVVLFGQAPTTVDPCTMVPPESRAMDFPSAPKASRNLQIPDSPQMMRQNFQDPLGHYKASSSEGVQGSGESEGKTWASELVSKRQQLDFGPELAAVAQTNTLAVHVDTSPSGQLSMLPAGSSQPQLTMDPPRTTESAELPGKAGLPKKFIERLYTCVTVMETGPGGQQQQVKRFKCLIEGCDRSFPRKSAVGSHIQTHLDDKPHVCDHEDCGAAFVRQHDLRRHQRIHRGDKPFNCECGKGFARGDALMRHRQRGICSGAIAPGQRTDQ